MKNKLHLEILDKKRQEIFEVLSEFCPADYYLAGGTALALQIAHRQSYDKDMAEFFSKEIKKSNLL